MLETRQRLMSHVKICFNIKNLKICFKNYYLNYKKLQYQYNFKGKYGHMTNNASFGQNL